MLRSSHRGRDERGSAAVEAVLVVPVLLLVMMALFQFGLWYHASHTAQAAAREGARAARLDGGTPDDGRERAARFLADAAPELITDVEVAATGGAQTVRIEVTGTVQSIVPGLSLPVHAVAESHVEQFEADEP